MLPFAISRFCDPRPRSTAPVLVATSAGHFELLHVTDAVDPDAPAAARSEGC
jgi:hypothetical protein